MDSKPRNLLSDSQWKLIEAGVKGRDEDPGRHGTDNRRFVDAVLWILRTGAPWRDLPRYFGRWNTVYKRFSRWARGGVWKTIWRQVRSIEKKKWQSAAKIVASLDSTSIKVHQHGAPAIRDRERNFVGISRGGKTTKVHVLASASNGCFYPHAAIFSPGNYADITFAELTVRASKQRIYAVAADKAYDSDALRPFLRARHMLPVIPTRRHRRRQGSVRRALYAQRNVVERLFARLKQFRRFATRFERRALYWQRMCRLAFLRAALDGRPEGLRR